MRAWAFAARDIACAIRSVPGRVSGSMPRPILALTTLAALAAGLHSAAPDPGMAAAAAAANASVSISGYAFRPEVVRIRAGDTVTWRVGNDPEQHTVTPRRAGVFGDSGGLFPGQAYRLAFPNSGTFAYFCRFHPTMQGVVEVAPADRSLPPPSEVAAAGQSSRPPTQPAPTAARPPGQTLPTPTSAAPAPWDAVGAGTPSPAGLALVAAAVIAGGLLLAALARRRDRTGR